MNHDPASHGAASTTESPFGPAELATLHAEDRAAARNIVVLMLVIFLIGITLYGVVDYVVAS